MNADGSGQTNISNHPAADFTPDWGSTGAAPPPPPPEEDTMPPILTVPADIVVDATSANGDTIVTYNVTAEDNVDGTAILEEDNTVTQDDIAGDITISCDPASGSEFPIGDTNSRVHRHRCGWQHRNRIIYSNCKPTTPRATDSRDQFNPY